MEKVKTWVSGGPQRKIQPETQRQNVENQRRSRNDDQRGRKKLRLLKLALVKQLYISKGNIVGVPQLRIWKKLIDRPFQLLYPLELHCVGITTNENEKKSKLNPSATEFRPKRIPVEIAKWHLKEIVVEEDDNDLIMLIK